MKGAIYNESPEERMNQEVRKNEGKDVHFKADSGQTAVGHHKQAGSHSMVQVQQLSLVQVQGRGHRRPPEGRYPLVQRNTSKLQHRGYGRVPGIRTGIGRRRIYE